MAERLVEQGRGAAPGSAGPRSPRAGARRRTTSARRAPRSPGQLHRLQRRARSPRPRGPSQPQRPRCGWRPTSTVSSTLAAAKGLLLGEQAAKTRRSSAGRRGAARRRAPRPPWFAQSGQGVQCVVLPAPLGPSSTRHSPAARLRLNSQHSPALATRSARRSASSSGAASWARRAAGGVHALPRGLRESSEEKTNTPISAVSARHRQCRRHHGARGGVPTGCRRRAPRRGSASRWSLPSASRTRCGTTRPTPAHRPDQRHRHWR